MNKRIKNLLIGAVLVLASADYLVNGTKESNKKIYRQHDSEFGTALSSLQDKDIQDALHGLYWNNKHITEGFVLGKPNRNITKTKEYNANTNIFFNHIPSESMYYNPAESREMFKEQLKSNLNNLYDALKKNPIALDDTLVNVVIESQKKVDQFVYNIESRLPNKEPTTLDLRI